MSNNPEVFNGGAESGVESQKAAAERSVEIAKNRAEKGVESSPEAQAEALEQARVEANKEALMNKERGGAEKKTGGEPSAAPTGKATQKQKDAEYKKTLKSIQSEMTPQARTFSKVIHNPAVEKTSEVVGKTIARPTSILSGSLTAFILVTCVYLIANIYGYALSGSETIIAFILGWAIGLIVDYMRALFSGGRHQ